MPKFKGTKPEPWITSLTGLMADDDNCAWSAWYKARYWYTKLDTAFDSIGWKATHKLARDAEAQRLRLEGWDVLVEGEVDFRVHGKGCTLVGKPDIVARKRPAVGPLLLRVVDTKTGKRYAKHWYQLALYIRWIVAVLGIEEPVEVEGRLVYSDDEPDVIITLADLTPDVKAVMNRELMAVGLAMQPEKTPSVRECRFCNIAECSERAAQPATAVETAEF